MDSTSSGLAGRRDRSARGVAARSATHLPRIAAGVRRRPRSGPDGCPTTETPRPGDRRDGRPQRVHPSGPSPVLPARSVRTGRVHWTPPPVASRCEPTCSVAARSGVRDRRNAPSHPTVLADDVDPSAAARLDRWELQATKNAGPARLGIEQQQCREPLCCGVRGNDQLGPGVVPRRSAPNRPPSHVVNSVGTTVDTASGTGGMRRLAIAAASRRLGALSLCRMCATWTLAVLALMTRSAAISRLV